jgi:hypothetical protein
MAAVGRLGVLAVSVSVWEARRPPTTLQNPLANAEFTRFTDWAGTEAGAEISPDGKFVAFVADQAGQFDIWLRQVATGDFRNVTANVDPMNPPGIILRSFGFSGDGAEIWFSLLGDPGLRKMLMPLTGGASRAASAPTPKPPPLAAAPAPDPIQWTAFRAAPFATVRPHAGVFAPLTRRCRHNMIRSVTDGQWIYFVQVGPDRRHGCVARATLGRNARAIGQQHAAVNFWRARPVDAALRVAR